MGCMMQFGGGVHPYRPAHQAQLCLDTERRLPFDRLGCGAIQCKAAAAPGCLTSTDMRRLAHGQDSNKALTSAPPAIRAVLTFLEKAVVKLKPAGAAPQAAKLPGTLTGVVEVK